MTPLIACTLLLFAANPSEGVARQDGGRRVVDGRGRLSLELPAGWEAVEDPVFARLGGLSLQRAAPLPVATLKAVAVDFRPKMDLDDYVENSTAAYRSIWKVEERSTQALAGSRAVRLVIVQQIGPDTRRLLKYFVAAGKGAAVITLAVEPEAFAERLDEFEAIVRSLKLEP